MEGNAEYEKLNKRLEPFPCAFNLVGTNKITIIKLRSIQHNLDCELEIGDGCRNELIIKKNLLTWILFRLEKRDDAVKLSVEIVKLTDRKNIASLANCCFLMWLTGDESGAMKCLKDLENMKSDNNFHTQFTDAQAEQAYYYSRMGGPGNLQRAVELFCASPKHPVNYLRRFGLGLVYRRMTHMNILCSSLEHPSVEDYQERAAEYLFEVAENADDRLRSLAYAQLANLRRSYSWKLSPEDQTMFRGLSVETLCDKAIEHGENIPTVLMQCGKAIKPIHIEKAIDWLKRSVAMRANSTAYHHLGICYKRKAEEDAKRQRYTRSNSEGFGLQNNVDQQRALSQNPNKSNDMTGTSQNTHRRYAGERTVNQQVNVAPMREMGSYRWRRSNPNYRGNRSECSNDLPHHVSSGYGQQGFQTPDFQNLNREISFQHATFSHQYRQRQEQYGYMPDRNPWRYQPSQVYYYVDGMLINEDLMFGPTFGPDVQFRDVYIQSVEEPQAVGGVEGQWSNQNVHIDGAPSVHDNVETLPTHGPMYSGAVAGSLAPNMYQGCGWNAQNSVFPPWCADSTYDASWGSQRTEQVQEYSQTAHPGLRNAQRTGYPHGSAQTPSTRSKHRPVRGTGLGRGHTRSMSGNDTNPHHLGQRAYSGDGRFEPKASLKSSVRSRRSILRLNKNDENVQEAKKCFEKAIEIAKENLPAILDLGILLKDANQINDALKQFNSITNSCNPSISHRLTLISAYEQAGLCFLELGRTEENEEYLETGKGKLSKAISIAADLIHTMPELQGSHKDVWQAFTTLLAVNDEDQKPDRLKRRIKILQLAREHGDIIDVIQKLKETGHEELTNPDIVTAALNSYLQLGQPDNALAYHNIVAMNPMVKNADWWNNDPMLSLRHDVLLHAIAGRLKNTDDNPTVLFQQLFELIFGLCVGLRDPENDQQTDSTVLGDVLFIFESDDEDTNEPTVKSARCLKRVIPSLFGLMAGENMKGTGEYGGDPATIQLKEMLKYQVVIIVLGNETRDRYFNAMLERVTYNREKAPPSQKILVINTSPEDDNIPVCLKQFKSLNLKDIGILGDPQRIPQDWNDTDPISYTDIVRDVFDGDVDAILKLFCFIIEQTWPCP